MDQSYGDIVFSKVPVKARTRSNEFVNFSRDFAAAEARANDYETEMPLPHIRIVRSLCLFHLAHDMLSKVESIAQDLEAKGVLRHSRDEAEVALSAASDHYMVVMHTLQYADSVVELDL